MPKEDFAVRVSQYLFFMKHTSHVLDLSKKLWQNSCDIASHFDLGKVNTKSIILEGAGYTCC